jgi:hypothetical protein
MSKVRKSPVILKPKIDERMALQFASAVPADDLSATSKGKPSAKKSSSGSVGKKVRQVTLTLKKDLYDKIAEEASLKDRTLEEHLIRHLSKRYP